MSDKLNTLLNASLAHMKSSRDDTALMATFVHQVGERQAAYIVGSAFMDTYMIHPDASPKFMAWLITEVIKQELARILAN